MLYQFNGDETADDIADFYIESVKEWNLFNVLSCTAVSDEILEEMGSELSGSLEALELIKLMIDQDSMVVTRSEAEPADISELNAPEGVPATYGIDLNDIDASDLVKYTIHIELTAFGSPNVQDNVIYIGKYKGEYRILNTSSMETFF